ncbi:MAG: DNA repair protein RecO, partial [Minisyncoccales bacterium]
ESKLRPQTDLFNLLEIEFVQGRSQKILTDLFLLSSFQRTKNYLYKVRYFYLISEKINNLILGEEKDERIFYLLKEVFELIDRSFVSKKICLFYLYFFWKLIAFLGWGVDFYRYLCCSEKISKGKNFFLASENGFFCEKCYKEKKRKEGRVVSENLLKGLRLLSQGPRLLEKVRMKEKILEELFSFSEDYYFSLKRNQL